MSETARDLTWQERQRSRQAIQQLTEELQRPPRADPTAAASQVANSITTTAAANAHQAGLAQTAARVAEMSTRGQRAVMATIHPFNPSITRIMRGDFADAGVGRLLQRQIAGLAADIGRVDVSSQMTSLTKTVSDVIGGGLRKAVQGIDGSVLGDYAKGLDLNRLLIPAMPNVHLLVSSQVRLAFEQIHSTLNIWSQALSSFDQIGRTLARIPLLAALRARRAVLRGDLAAVHEFIVDWLERRPTEPMVEATIDALLEDDWMPCEGDVAQIQVLEHLRARTTDSYTRRHKMVGSTQILGRTVESLDRLVPLGPSSDLVPLVAMIADPSARPAQYVAPADEKRVLRALARFKPEEQKVLQSWEPGMTWQDAAAAAGLTPDVAERVRRKRKRVAAEDARRLAQRLA